MISIGAFDTGGTITPHRRAPAAPALRAAAAAFLLLGAWVPAIAVAQGDAYPAKVIRMVSSLSAGSSGDRVTRAFADALSQRISQRIVVDNRTGDGGNIAAQAVARAPAEGYTLLFGSTATLAIQMTYSAGKIGYDLRRDLAPISKVAEIPNGLFVTPVVPADSLAAFVALAKARPGQYSCASSGVGGLLHLTCELFKKVAGIDLLHVPHKGSTAFLPEIMEGRITLAFDNVPAYVPLVEAGKLKVLAVTAPQRAAVLPNVPTTAELGLPQLESVGLFGLFAPARTPAEIVTVLSRESVEALRQAALLEQLSKQGVEARGSTPQGLRDQVDSEINKWARVIKEANIAKE